MTKEEILSRIEQIAAISKEKASIPPAHLVLAIDGKLIDENLYDEYEMLIKTKIENKYYTKSEQSKLEQLSYIKDKLTFLENKAKGQKNSISILPDDISEYSDALNIFNELSAELKFITNPIVTDNKLDDESNLGQNTKSNIDIETSVLLPNSKKVSISLEDSDLKPKTNKDNKVKDNNKTNLFQVLDIPSSKQTTIPKVNTSNNILKDLADIDEILNNINITSPTKPVSTDSPSKFFIGSIVSPIEDVASYNDSSIVADKNSNYRIVSFVALDKDDNVVTSSNTLGLSFREFSEENPTESLYFILAKNDGQINDLKQWANRSVSIDLSNCIGSFSSPSSFEALASPSSV